jgi:glyoxylase-like metal-dependent hydrolase (beta-lactamase superfamily II)
MRDLNEPARTRIHGRVQAEDHVVELRQEREASVVPSFEELFLDHRDRVYRALDVPGNPRVILTPGHTPGSAALHFPSLNALFVGDAFATYAVTTGARGPQVAPFTADATQAVPSLARLEGISADLVLPGHGDSWTNGLQEAVRQVRQPARREG